MSSLVCQSGWRDELGRMDPLPGNQRSPVCRVPHSGWCAFRSASSGETLSLRSGACHIGAARPTGSTPRPRTFPQLTPHAITWSVNARRSLAGAGFHPGRRSAPRASSSGTRQGSTPRRGHPRPLLDPGTWRRPRFWASTGPFSGPILPLPEKGGENATFLGGCGAKSWGSGGAPPTNLILLRNQRAASRARRAAHRGRRRGSLGGSAGVVGGVRRPPGPSQPVRPQAPTPCPTPCPDSSSPIPEWSGWVGEWSRLQREWGRIWRPTRGTFYLRLRRLRLRRFALPRIQSQKGRRCPLTRPTCSVIRASLSR